MSVSKLQVDSELHVVERALEDATERRRVAEQALWEAVRSSGRTGATRGLVDAARLELVEAEHARAEAEAMVADLRTRLAHAREREARLLAVTDMLMARDQARRANGAHLPPNGNGGSTRKPGRRRSFFDRFRRH